MSEPYVGQIILFAGNRAPDGWAFCDGRQLPSADFPALFQTIGTTYGGDGQSTFALPDLRGRVPLGDNAKYPIGTMLGQEDVTLTGQQIAPHSHPASAGSQQGNANVPVSNTLIAPLGGEAASQYGLAAYAPPGNNVTLNARSVGNTGGSQPHENRQPYLAINYCISLAGGGPALPYVGQIALFGFNFAPRGWAQCEGQLLPLSQNIPLFSILGTAYGGNGATTFALPDLRGSAALGTGQAPGLSQYDLGQNGGEPAVTLLTSELPVHNHGLAVSANQATSNDPNSNLLARAWRALERTDAVASFYSAKADHAQSPLSGQAIGGAGGGQPHNNMQPYLVLSFCIAMQGFMPAPR